MPPTAETALVPLSHPLGSGTAGQTQISAGQPRDKSEIFSLKALVSLVSQRDSQRDTGGTVLSHEPPVMSGEWDKQRDRISSATDRDANLHFSPQWSAALANLTAASPPRGWPLASWRATVDNAVAMVREQGNALVAHHWTMLELFGLDVGNPWARLDGVGACRFLIDRRVSLVRRNALALTADRASVVQTFRRPAPRPGLVLAWELRP